MNYREALAWLFGTQLFGIKLGLENIQRLLRALDLPAGGQGILHVAGTNGKGSVCAMLDSILRAQNYRSGLFTSPHLVTFRERIRVNGEMISKDAVAHGLTSIRALVASWEPHPTFFEITTALALHHFKETRCQFIVLETGMGGRLDATNAVAPIVSVITPIALDHQKWLGNSLGEIAAEKAGIIRPKTPVVSSWQAEEARKVIQKRALDCNAPLGFVSQEYSASRISLAGSHQKQNAALAVAALEAANVPATKQSIADGLATVQWPARFQFWNKHTVIDGAHNPAGANVLAQTWRANFDDQRAVVILAILRDKQAADMIAALAPIAKCFILVKARSERALSATELLTLTRRIAPDVKAERASSFAEAYRESVQRGLVLVTGSLHFAGEALAYLSGETDSLEDCLQ